MRNMADMRRKQVEISRANCKRGGGETNGEDGRGIVENVTNGQIKQNIKAKEGRGGGKMEMQRR